MKSAERMQDERSGVGAQRMAAAEMCETGLLTSASLHTCCN